MATLLLAARRKRRRRVSLCAAAVVVLGAVANSARADVIVAEDFFYNQPTKEVGDNSGFRNQDYGGGQNGPLGNWVGRWGAVGDANITGPDHPVPEEQFMGRTSDIFDAANLNRGYVLNGVAADQTLYFGASIRNPAEDDVNDPMPRFVLNLPGGADLSEISMGFEAGSFAAILGEQVATGTETTFDQAFHRLVGKLEINAAGDNERLTVWLDPTDVETAVESVTVESDVITGLDAPEFTGLMALQVAVGTFGAQSAWFDDVAIGTTWEDAATISVPRLTLRINTVNGDAKLINDTGFDFDLNFIEVLSESGSLIEAGSQVVAAGWQENNPSDTALTQSNFGGATPLADGGQMSLGSIFDLAGTQDLLARFGTNVGLLNLAGVEYVDVETTPGDFDENNVVDGADFLEWQRQYPSLSLSDWETNFGTVAAASRAARVPEPSTFVLVATAALVWWRRSREPR